MGMIAASIAPPAPNLKVLGTALRHCPGCGSGGEKLVLEIPGEPGADREAFAYTYCDCQTLSFAEDGFDVSRYYESGYYSLSHKRQNPLKQAGMRARNAATAFAPKLVSDAVRAISEHTVLPQLRPIIHGDYARPIGKRDRWLDIGCGAGALLHDMRDIGFANLTGCDPFMLEPRTETGLRLMRRDPHELGETFDCVMMHHSLEHVPDPEDTLLKLHQIVAGDGVLLIRIPLCGSTPWELHGGEWGNLDAPRHLTLWSRQGFIRAANRAGWAVRGIVCDAMPRSLYSGEARLRGVSELTGDARGLFSKAELKAFAAEVAEHNTKSTADAAAFYLTRPREPHPYHP